jgi:hypothetical protein
LREGLAGVALSAFVLEREAFTLGRGRCGLTS